MSVDSLLQMHCPGTHPGMDRLTAVAEGHSCVLERVVEVVMSRLDGSLGILRPSNTRGSQQAAAEKTVSKEQRPRPGCRRTIFSLRKMRARNWTKPHFRGPAASGGQQKGDQEQSTASTAGTRGQDETSRD